MIFFIAVMVWVGGIFLTSDQRTRIDRGCLPATFADRVIVAIVQVLHEPYAMRAHEIMLSLEYGCKFTIWKTFYENREPDVVITKTPQAQPAKQKGEPKVVEPKSVGPDLAEIRIPKTPTRNEPKPVAPIPSYLGNE